MSLRAFFKTLFGLSLALSACKKEPTTWDSDIEAPLMTGELGLADLLPSGDLVDDSSQTLHLIRDDTLFRLPLDSILQLPDTTLVKSYINNFGSFIASPGQTLINSSEDRELGVNGVELVEAVLEQGALEYEAKSTIGERTLFTYRVPSATKDGQILKIEGGIPPGSHQDPAVVSGTHDLSGYHLDLTGTSGGEVNRMRTELELRIDPDGEDVTVENADSVVIRNSFKNLAPSFARGYFGQRSFAPSYQEHSLGLFEKVSSGVLDIDSVSVRFLLDNGVGMDARVEFPLIRAIGREEVDLDHSLTQDPINLSRAQYQNGTMLHAQHEEVLTPANSNVDLFLEALPERIGQELELQTNPLGDVSNGNDVMLAGHDVELRMRIDLPLSFAADDLTLVDTTDWKFGGGEGGKVIEGSIFLDVANGFPFSTELTLILLDDAGASIPLFEDRTVSAAPMNASWEATGEREERIRLSLNEEKMEWVRQAEKAVLKARFNTPSSAGHVDLHAHYGIGVKLLGDFRYRTRLE